LDEVEPLPLEPEGLGGQVEAALEPAGQHGRAGAREQDGEDDRREDDNDLPEKGHRRVGPDLRPPAFCEDPDPVLAQALDAEIADQAHHGERRRKREDDLDLRDPRELTAVDSLAETLSRRLLGFLVLLLIGHLSRMSNGDANGSSCFFTHWHPMN